MPKWTSAPLRSPPLHWRSSPRSIHLGSIITLTLIPSHSWHGIDSTNNANYMACNLISCHLNAEVLPQSSSPIFASPNTETVYRICRTNYCWEILTCPRAHIIPCTLVVLEQFSFLSMILTGTMDTGTFKYGIPVLLSWITMHVHKII